MKLMANFDPEVLENISVENKVNYLVRLTQFSAICAIVAGIIGMLISNVSIRSLNENALEPLGHLRVIKEFYEQKVLVRAQQIAHGRITNYVEAANHLRLEKKIILHEWNAYKQTSLTKEEIKLLPDAEKYMQLSLNSLDILIGLVKEKNLLGVISWTTDDAPYTISELNPLLNQLMQIEIVNAQNIYATTQIQFFGILVIIVFISLLGYWYIGKMVKRVVLDLTLPFVKLLKQSHALAKQELDEPFIWKRTDEIGQVGKSLEESRQALHDAFVQIEVKNKELMQHTRLAQMGEMISMIAHQWRQPLGAIASTAVNMKVKLEMEAFDLDTENGRSALNRYFTERLNKIEDYVDNLTTTIDDFRNFYRPDKKKIDCSFQEVIHKALKIIGNSIELDNIEIIEEYRDTGEFKLYDNEMIQVVLNLLKNAQDNFREKRTIHPVIRISAENNILRICDNGGGIPNAIIEKIFDPYFSTKDEKNGTGLGLHMSRVIVEEHHKGKLHVKNHDDGVCFEIRLENKE
jgi:signal transduction histidine kinase